MIKYETKDNPCPNCEHTYCTIVNSSMPALNECCECGYKWNPTYKWNIKNVKEELPDIKVKIGRKIYIGQMFGRKEKFAIVSCDGRRFEVAWETVVMILNNDSYLKGN